METKLKKMLTYIGTVGAVAMGIAYIGIVLVMVFGMSIRAKINETILFAVVNAVIGFIIMQFLKVQGIAFAKNIEENALILKEYNGNKTKDKKFKSIKFYWTTSVIKDIIIKAATIGISTSCIIYIAIKGTYDYMYFLLAVVNLIMFTCFGLLSLVSAYDFFNEKHIPYIKEQLYGTKRKKEEEKEAAFEAEVQKRLEMAKKEYLQQRNDMVCADRRDNILESSMDMCTSCADSKPMVLDSGDRNNSILDGTIHTCNNASDRIDSFVEENTSNVTEETKC